MATQKVEAIVLDIDANTLQIINDKLTLGFIVQSITNLNPTFDKLLIIYNKNLTPTP